MLPQRLIVGDSLDHLVDLNLYPAPTWVLKFRLVPRGNGDAQTITCAASGTSHRAVVAATVTALWASGPYSYAGWVEQGALSITVAQGSITLLPDPRVVDAGTDGRSIAQTALDAAKAALAAWTPTTRRYSINGREMEFAAAADILTVISYWERQVRLETRAANLAAGKTDTRQVYVRLGRA